MKEPKDRIILSLDALPLTRCVDLVQVLCGHYAWVKFDSTQFGDESVARIVDLLRKAGASYLWNDLKLSRPYELMGTSVLAQTNVGVDAVSVMAESAVEAMKVALEVGIHRVIAVLLLTSLGDNPDPEETDTVQHIYHGVASREIVRRRASMAVLAGVGTVQCPGPDLPAIKGMWNKLSHLITVVPGVRTSLMGGHHDQKRVIPISAAIRGGADYVVVGREVTTSDDPLGTIRKIEEAIALGETKRSFAGGGNE